MDDIYEKIAKARWQREEPGLSSETVRARRADYYAQAPGLPESWSIKKTPGMSPQTTHRVLQGKLVDQRERHGLVVRPTPDMPNGALRMAMGPGAYGGTVNLPRDTGEFLRQAGNPVVADPLGNSWMGRFLPESVRRQTQMRAPAEPNPLLDRAVEHATMLHEQGELSMGAASRAPHDPVPVRRIGTHLGALPLVAERHGTWLDPEAGAVFDRLRTKDPDNAFVTKEMKARGHTPNNPMPMGGKAHRSLEGVVARRVPAEANARHGRLGDAFAPLQTGAQKAMTALMPAGVRAATNEMYASTGHTPGVVSATYAAGLQKVEPVARSLYQRLKAFVPPSLQPGLQRAAGTAHEIFDAAHRTNGTPTGFLRHLSSLR